VSDRVSQGVVKCPEQRPGENVAYVANGPTTLFRHSPGGVTVRGFIVIKPPVCFAAVLFFFLGRPTYVEGLLICRYAFLSHLDSNLPNNRAAFIKSRFLGCRSGTKNRLRHFTTPLGLIFTGSKCAQFGLDCRPRSILRCTDFETNQLVRKIKHT